MKFDRERASCRTNRPVNLFPEAVRAAPAAFGSKCRRGRGRGKFNPQRQYSRLELHTPLVLKHLTRPFQSSDSHAPHLM
jgi:hypothetical protein